jgi:hypothetical protein
MMWAGGWGAEYFCVEVVFSLKERVSRGESQPRLLLVSLVIFILTASALRSRETPPTAFPVSFIFCHREGDWFSVEHDCPGAGVLGAYAFGQSSGKYVTWRVFRAQYLFCTYSRHRAADLRSKSPRQAATRIDSSG